ncbi:TMEM175 family protein [Streptomyces sp. 150FB]|uniref:TMEM175 family protein n=1 Tax=Streptomyces sp. 150FB TaxID=1576605 RepID=UPI000697736A|nr:TMEM175 family protein [Streptomyces sp. 150FB]
MAVPDVPSSPAWSGAAEAAVEEHATRRLFTLSDGVFAIAMTLLALDLRVPSLGDKPSDGALRHALADQSSRYLSFLISFYVIAGYWRRHRSETHLIHASGIALVRPTMFLLLMVSSLPFVTNLLATYGREGGIVVALYGGVNVIACVCLLVIRHVVRTHQPPSVVRPPPHPERFELWFDLVALVLVIPAGYAFPGRGPDILIGLLVFSGIAGSVVTRLLRRRLPPAPPPAPQPPTTDARPER